MKERFSKDRKWRREWWRTIFDGIKRPLIQSRLARLMAAFCKRTNRSLKERWITHKLNRGNNNSIFMPLTIILIGGFLFYFLAYVFFWEPLGFKKANWSERRSMLLTISMLLAPIVIVAGYFLSIRRTQALFKQNELNETKLEHSQLSQGLELLASGEKFKQLAGVSLMAKLGIASRQSGEGENYNVLKLCAETKDLDNTIREAALRNLFNLIAAHNRFRTSGVVYLVEAKFGIPTLEYHGTLQNAVLINCKELPKHISYMTFDEVVMNHCALINTVFSSVTFKKIRFFHCTLENVYFEHCEFQNISGVESTSFKGCSYPKDCPPLNLPRGMQLGAPSEVISGQATVMSKVQAEAFWSKKGNEKYRPRDRDGNLITIFYPDEDVDQSLQD